VVLIEVTDDGKGIDPAAIRDSAVRKGLLSEAEARGLSEAEALELVFLPGFSTATEVTRLSGRGVGMDVVRTQLRQVGGAVDLQSVKGAGTTLRLRLPLTLAIVPALVVEANGRTFCVPQANLVEIVDTVRLDPRRLQRVGGAAVLRLRDQLLPLVHLGGALGLGAKGGPEGGLSGGAEGGAPCGTIVVCEADGGRLGLIVDALHDTEEIVVKPLSPELKQQGIWAGATVRGDGSVTLILDIAGLGTRARALGTPAPTAAVQRAAPVDPMLRVAVAGVGQALIPLHPVLRCDDLQDITLHTQGALRLVTYDGDLVPVRPLTEELRAVVIFERGGARFALGVTEVLDVFAEPTRLTPGLGPAWAKASGLVRGSPAALVDLDTIAAELSR
jgi:two-component system chemotaxis sensor kinase CheA